MRIPSRFWMMIAIGLAVAACDSGGNGNDSTATAPTLGITSVQKVEKLGATAIPNSNVASKPVFASNLLGKGWSLAPRQAFAAACPTTAPLFFGISGGKIWVNKAYAILDEVEFNREPSTTPSPEFGPFALDLTNSDDTVGEAITIDVPEGNYSGVKFRIKRVDDNNDDGVTPMVILNVTDSAAFKDLIMESKVKRRPSFWIEGVIEVDGSATCTPFTFVADRRWEVTIPLVGNLPAGSTTVDAVLLFDLEGAFKSGMGTSDAAALTNEVGLLSNHPDFKLDHFMGSGYLDGRTRDESHGTPIAEAVAAALPKNMKVFIQSADAVRGFDDNLSVPEDRAMVISNADPGTVIDNSAVRVGNDDHPSVETVETEPPG